MMQPYQLEEKIRAVIKTLIARNQLSLDSITGLVLAFQTIDDIDSHLMKEIVRNQIRMNSNLRV